MTYDDSDYAELIEAQKSELRRKMKEPEPLVTSHDAVFVGELKDALDHNGDITPVNEPLNEGVTVFFTPSGEEVLRIEEDRILVRGEEVEGSEDIARGFREWVLGYRMGGPMCIYSLIKKEAVGVFGTWSGVVRASSEEEAVRIFLSSGIPELADIPANTLAVKVVAHGQHGEAELLHWTWFEE